MTLSRVFHCRSLGTRRGVLFLDFFFKVGMQDINRFDLGIDSLRPDILVDQLADLITAIGNVQVLGAEHVGGFFVDVAKLFCVRQVLPRLRSETKRVEHA